MTDSRGLLYVVSNGREDRAITRTITIGRHHRCDFIVPGSGVQDEHASIVPDRRGPRVQPALGASVMINGRRLDRPVGIMPGDRLELGDEVLEFMAVATEPPEADVWQIFGVDGAPPVKLENTLCVGRGADSDIRLRDLHASRRHAILSFYAGTVWVRDLDSVNGTFINGDRVRGAARVFHGDELRFDRYVCQLVGRGGNLTPLRLSTGHDRLPLTTQGGTPLPALGHDTQQFEPDEITMDNLDRGETVEPGTYLVDSTQTGAGGWYRLRIGLTLVGREPECDLRLRDLSVSGRHLEIGLRPEGATITDLMSTNGTRVNGKRVRTARLRDGDVISVGRTRLGFREVRRPRRARNLFRWLRGGRD